MSSGIGAAEAYLLVRPDAANDLDRRTALDRYYAAQRPEERK